MACEHANWLSRRGERWECVLCEMDAVRVRLESAEALLRDCRAHIDNRCLSVTRDLDEYFARYPHVRGRQEGA